MLHLSNLLKPFIVVIQVAWVLQLPCELRHLDLMLYFMTLTCKMEWRNHQVRYLAQICKFFSIGQNICSSFIFLLLTCILFVDLNFKFRFFFFKQALHEYTLYKIFCFKVTASVYIVTLMNTIITSLMTTPSNKCDQVRRTPYKCDQVRPNVNQADCFDSF